MLNSLGRYFAWEIAGNRVKWHLRHGVEKIFRTLMRTLAERGAGERTAEYMERPLSELSEVRKVQ